MLSAARATLLKPHLDALVLSTDKAARIQADPVEFPKRYRDPLDVELVALVSASLAYGRADLFKPKLEGLFQKLGPRPSELAREFNPAKHAALFEDFSYRFNLGADLASLVCAAGRLQREHGSLGNAFAEQLSKQGALQPALAAFVHGLRENIDPGIVKRLGKPRDLAHLLPDPAGGSACKRLLLFLRWMVRPADGVDFGLWPVSPAALVIPLDTHIGRISKFLGFTARKDLSWRTAEEITASLRRIDPSDPVKYDFALCHYGMSGRCPARSSASTCGVCALSSACRKGPVVLRRAGASS